MLKSKEIYSIKQELCIKGRSFIVSSYLNLQAVGDNLQGAVNCVLFCFLTPKVWNHIKESCYLCTGKCYRNNDDNVDDETTNLLPGLI